MESYQTHTKNSGPKLTKKKLDKFFDTIWKQEAPHQVHIPCYGCGTLYTNKQLESFKFPLCHICGADLILLAARFNFFGEVSRVEVHGKEDLDMFLEKIHASKIQDNNRYHSNYHGFHVFMNLEVPENEIWLAGKTGVIKKFKLT